MRSRTLAWSLAACLVVAVAVRVAAFHVAALRALDLDTLSALIVRPHTPVYVLASAITWPFEPLPFAVLVLAVTAAAFAGGRPVAGVAAAGTMLGSAITTQLLKQVLAAPRPTPGHWYLPDYLPSDAWPSGHTTAAAGLAAALVLITPPGRRGPVAAAGIALVAAAGVSLVALGYHYPSDVIGGLCVAGAWAAVAFRVAEHADRAAGT